MSAISEIYTAIELALQPLIDSKVINEYGLFNSQYIYMQSDDIETPSKIGAVNFPSVFIQFDIPDWESKQVTINEVYRQQADVYITLHCGFSDIRNISDSFFDIDEKLNKIIASVYRAESENISKIIRTQTKQNTDNNNIIVWEISFKCKAVENYINEEMTDVGDGSIILELNTDLDIDHPTIRTGNGTI